MIRPLLKWCGGKAWLVPRVMELLPPRIAGTYREPFAGGAAVFLSLRPEQLPLFGEPGRQHVPAHRASLCDLSPDLVQFYEAVRDDPEGVMAVLGPLRDRYLAEPVGETPALGPRADLYRDVRAELNRTRRMDNNSALRCWRAAWFLFINKTGFNGLMRYSRTGDLNTPHGAMVRPVMFDPEHVRAVSRALCGVRLTCRDFEEDLADAGPGDAVYLDPPHAPRSPVSSFVGYTGAGWSRADDERVARVYWDLARRGVRVILSQADTAEAREAVFSTHRSPEVPWSFSVQHRRGTVSSKGGGREPVGELLVAAGPV